MGKLLSVRTTKEEYTVMITNNFYNYSGIPWIQEIVEMGKVTKPWSVPGKPYHIVPNNSILEPGEYSARWNDGTITTEGEFSVTFSAGVSVRGTDIPIELSVNKWFIEVYLKN